MTRQIVPICAIWMTLFASTATLPAAESEPTFYPAALLTFQERGVEARDLGDKVTDILFASLVVNPQLYLVEREDLQDVFDELKLNLSGMVKPHEAARVGQFTGAKILITGSVIQVNGTLYLVAKIIGVETSRVLGASVKGQADDDLGPLVEQLAEQVGRTIQQRGGELVADALSKQDRIAALSRRIADAGLPIVRVNVTEEHVGQAVIDPAAQTELTLFLTETGFQVVEEDAAASIKPDILLVGEGLSEFAGQVGGMISVKARLEVKAIDAKSGRVLAVDRQVAVHVDLVEHIAGKQALQEAAALIAERMLPKLAPPQPKSGN